MIEPHDDQQAQYGELHNFGMQTMRIAPNPACKQEEYAASTASQLR